MEFTVDELAVLHAALSAYIDICSEHAQHDVELGPEWLRIRDRASGLDARIVDAV